MKLIRVHDGIYRNESGGVQVFRRPWVDKDRPWVVCWEDIFGCRKQEWFRTLGEVRKYLNGGKS